MNRLIATTTALAVALNGAAPILAQTLDAEGRVIGPDGAVLCTPAEGAACDLEAVTAKLAAEAEALAAEAAAEAERAAAEAARAEAEAAAQAEADAAAAAAAQAEADAAAAAAAQAEADAAAAAQAEADAAAKAAEDAAAAAAEQAAAAAQAEADAAAAAQAKADAAAKATDEAAQAEAEPATGSGDAVVVTPAAEPVVPPAPEPEAVESLEAILSPETPAADGTEAAPPVAAAAPAEDADAEAPAPVSTTKATITEADTRSSAEEFSAAPQADAQGRRGLSDLERVGLVALGALAVGAILKNGDRVVSNTGDRVVVDRGDGRFEVLKDDDTLLRRPGSTVETETFRDGSSRTVVTRGDGSSIVTIRDAAGRVLRRARVDADGRETLLVDDLAPVRPVDVTTLPPPAPPVTISGSGADASLSAALAAIAARESARGFSLRQIRDLREVRMLAPAIDVTPITFRTGSAAIDVSEAEKLAALGRFIADTVRERPFELFLVEGHTDAVGSAASNLALSDRRAESVALALTEYFGVPPENLIVQGYGEGDLLIPVETAEPLNRRVAVRLISPLLEARLR
ncbi:MAG: OmpA family protein [Paracoccaceae bacterium]|nr:MAG: OmpA family protein [Paracoccaceae bacterium]